MSTISRLIAYAHGVAFREGTSRCFYCGESCTDDNSGWVKDSCTVYHAAACPQSRVVCDGCALALREKADIVLADGERRSGQKMRGYSWVLTKSSATAYSKAHVELLRAVCLEPPSAPYGITISPGGQKHLIYLTQVVLDSDNPSVCLDGEAVKYTPGALSRRLEIAEAICAAVGKPALSESLAFSAYRRMAEHFGNDRGLALCEEWRRVAGEPLSRLASFLASKKEIACGRYPKVDA